MNVRVNDAKMRQEQVEEVVRKKFEEVRNSGLIAGSKAICAVVLEKAKDEATTIEERLADIIDFCERSIGVAKKYDEENK